MKILITSDLYVTETNGVVVSVTNLRSELLAAGHDVRVLSFSGDRHSHKEDGVYYIGSMPFSIYPDVRAPLNYRHRYIKELIAWRPDVIHSQCEFFSMPFAKRISKKTGAPIVHTYHTLYEQYVGYIGLGKRFGKRMVRSFMRKALKKVSLVIAPTAKTEAILQGYCIKPPIRVLPTGIRLEQHRIRLTEQQRKEGRAAYGIGENDRVMLYLGRLGAEKNVEELLRMFAKASKTHENLYFMIVGGGPAKEALEKECAQLGLEGRVIFTGMVDPTRVQEYYQLGDLFVCASTSEAQGLTYVEAAANGLPMLCREDLCLNGILQKGENGYSYTNEEEFDAALEQILSDAQWRAAAGRKSETLADVFDKSNFGKNIQDAYCSVLQDRPQKFPETAQSRQ